MQVGLDPKVPRLEEPLGLGQDGREAVAVHGHGPDPSLAALWATSRRRPSLTTSPCSQRACGG